MKKIRDLTGQRFGRTVVKEFAYKNSHGLSCWRCVCDCGKEHIACGTTLTRGHTRSCGCLHDELARKRATKHNGCKTKLYTIWQAMRRRCFDIHSKSYSDYGARGITVCKEWATSYKCFRDWAFNNGYEDGLTIDRINNNGNYCASNCRWATRAQQNDNTRRTIKIKYKNKTQTLTEWCNELGLRRDTIYARIYSYGWPIEKAFNTKIGVWHGKIV